MFDATKDLNARQLQENFEYWIAKWMVPSTVAEIAPSECSIPTAHTFGFYKEFGGTRRYIYEDILLKDGALLSDKYRKQNNKFFPHEYRARVRMDRARKIKLHHFVFSYFGIHDPYYTHGKGIAIPGFGVFIKTGAEKFPACNSTRRDVSSPEVKRPLRREFLLPSDARVLAYLQAINDARHTGDFWHYWGDPKRFAEGGYSVNHWQWKFEMHFRDKVPVEDFDAILWPFELRAVRAGKMERRLLGEYESFRARFPYCKVIPYNWKEHGQTYSLVLSSYAVARFYFARMRYPEDADDAIGAI